MIKIKQAVIVEGKYDKVKLSNILDTIIIETDGFGIFKNKEKQRLIRRLADSRGILILTDSDSAGFVIRSFLNGIVSADKITNAYIPDVFGKEKRKTQPSKEGKLGVEGIKTEQIIDALKKAQVVCEKSEVSAADRQPVTKTDLFCDGLNGTQNSAKIRCEFLKQLDLPEHLSANAMLKLINAFMTYDDYKQEVKKLKEGACKP